MAFADGLNKRSARSATRPDNKAAWRVGFVLLSVIVVAARLALPQPVAPLRVPFPVLDIPRVQIETKQEAERADSARRGALAIEVRAVGELVRRMGTFEAAAHDPAEPAPAAPERTEPERTQRELTHSVQRLVAQGQVATLLQLRALQTALFLSAFSTPSGTASAELQELGGGFARYLNTQLTRAVPLSELAAAYRLRWTRLVGLSQHVAFAPTLNDARLNARLRLRWAEQQPVAERQALTLKAVAELAEIDEQYPVAFARGIAHYQAGAFSDALEHFTAYLQRHPDGPWVLRARNHAQAAARYLATAEPL